MTWLTPDGLAAALVVGAAVLWGFGWRGAVVLLAFFISGSLLTRFATGGGARRTARQVAANGGVAAVAAILGSWSAAMGAIAAATADTWATEFGVFSPVPPRLVTTWTRAPRGASGGVTALGTLGGMLGAGLIAVLAHHFAPRTPAPGVPVIAFVGMAGMLADSLLGATAQGLYECAACGRQTERREAACHGAVRLIKGWRWLDNDAVNLLATVVGAVLALVSTRAVS